MSIWTDLREAVRLELFGSAVSGFYRQNESGLDFLVEFEPLPLGSYADAFFGRIIGA